jgi:hypothetical protein
MICQMNIQQQFNNDLADYIALKIDEIFTDLVNGVKDFTEIEKELRKYIIVDKKHFKIYATQNSKEISFVMFDENNKPIDVKIIQREKSRTIKIGKESTNSRNDSEEEYNTELARAIRGLKRNVNLSKTEGASQKRGLAYQEFTDFTGKEWKSYKDFLIETGAIITNMTKVVDHTGNKTLSYTNPRGVRPQSIVVGAVIDKQKRNKYPISFTSTGKVLDFAKANGLDQRYNFAYELADALGTTINTGVQSDPISIADLRNNKITFYEKYTSINRLEQSTILAHEIIHGLLENTIDEAKYEPFFNDIKTFYNSIRDKALASKDKTVVDIIKYIDGLLKTNENTALEEVITYGLTNQNFARFLQSIEVENKAGKITFTKSAWSEFKRVILDIIQAVAKELGIVTKLDELNYILDSYSNIVNNTNNTPDANPNPQPKDKPDPFGGRKSDDNANPFDEGKLAVITSSNGYSNTVNYVLTAVDLLSSDKGINIFNKRDKNGWTLEKTLTELQVPKEQKQLILTLGITDREEIILDLVSKYTYTVEVNTAKTETYLDVDKPSGIKENTQYYSNVTVSGGTNYTENEIATPLITPSIISHAQFATDKGIGWFRSDEEIGNKTEYSNTFKKDLTKPLDFDNIDDNNIVLRKGSKTRRILEVQSDLFQKGRDENQLTGSKEVIAPSLTTISKEEYSNASKLGTHLEYESIKYNGFLYFAEAGKDEETGELVSTYFKRSAETKNINIDEQGNQFLQLLNKDNNWVTFFVKSIIQDSAKKGYEKVLFPSGDTASKVEGHQTLEEFKRVKEIRLKELEREINNVDTGKSIKNHPFIPQIHQELEREEKGWRVYSNNVPEQLYTIEQIKEPYNREINQIKQELELAERDFGSLRKIWNFYEKDIANILDKRGYSPKLITDEYGNTWNEVEINQARDTGVAKLATITSSQANVNEAKDQIIQALIRTGGLNKNKYNNKYWVRKYKVGDYLEDKQNSLKENKEKVLKKIDQINTFAGSAVVGLNSTDAGATIFFNEYNLQTYANSYKKVLYELKNVPVGYTRLYRGEIFQADLFNTSPLFSRSLEEAVNYNKKYGGNTGKVSYVDVPKDRVDLFRYFDKTTPELEKYYLPTQILSKTKTVVIKINEEENNRKLATITSSYSKDLYVAEGFTAEDELHAYRDLLVTKFLRASMNGQIAATTLKEIREDRSKSVKFLIGDSILKQAKDDYANDLITLEQAQFINKVLDDLNKPTSLLWAKAKDYINNNYGIQIVGEEDFLIDDFTIEIPATWDDRVQFKIPSDETINHLVKSLIYTTPVVDGDKTQVLPNGELVYEVNKSTPSGYAKMLEFDAVYPYLREHMSGLMTKHDMLNKIFELGTLHDKSLFVIWNELNKNENLANAWYSSFNFQIPERHVILLDSQDGVNNIKTDIGNRTAFRQYALSNEWIGNIKLNIETAVYKEEKLWAEYMDLKQKLEDATQRFYTYEDDIYDILSKLFNMFGVDLTPKEMRYFVDNPENQAGYIDDTSMKRVNPKVEIINKYFLQRINYLSEYAIGNNTDNAFGEYSRMLELANMTLKFRYFKGNMSSINVANNLVHAPIKPNFLSEWFKTKDNANTHPDFEELLRQHAGTRKMQFSNWLWNNWSAYTKDTKNIDNPIGFLEILRDKDGTREIVGINSKFARAFKYRLDEGRKNLVTDEGQEYTTITDNLSKLITYLGERKDNMTMYELFNSDSGHTYYMSGVLFPLRYAEYEGKVTRDSVVYKAMRNTVYQEVANLIENFNLVFEREEDEEGLIQYVYDANGLPKVKEEVKHELVLNKHINKKGEVFDANDKLVGRAFTFTGASFNRKIGNSIENVNLGTYLEKVKNRKVFDKNGMLIPGVLASYAEDINDFVDEFIEDLIEKNYELNLQHEEYLTEAAINGGTALGSYRDFRHFISEYALNSYINNVEQKNFFGANTDEIANSLDFSKRANQITKTKQSYDYSGTPSRPYGKYRTLTVSSVFTKGTIYESLMKEFNDAKAAKPFKSINTTDGFSVITLDEFEERAKRNGTYEDNKALIEYLRNPDPTVDKDTLRKLQSLKHFYYGYEYNPILNQFVSVQVKNSEAILVPQFIKGTDMEQLYNFMVRNNVQQLDFNDSIKMGDTPYGYRNFDKLIDKNGNLDFSNGEIAAEVSNDLIKSIKERSYKNLGVQQTVVDHIEDETIKMGVQISKMITNNLQLDKNYNVGGNKIKGKDLITHYDNLWTTKIERQFTQLMVELDIKDVPSIQEITKLIGKNIELQIENAQRTGEWDTISVNPATIISTIVESIAEKVNEKKVYEILLSELKKRTTNINSVLGATINEETNTTFMPVYWSSANKQNMNILASLFTNNVGVLKLPGIHATLASGVFYSNKNAITKKNEQGNYVFKEGEITYINKVAERPDKDLRYTILNNGKVIKAEVLLPAWSKKFFQEGQLVNINELPEEIRTMIGYRIPTEGKRSMFVFEVVGFLPDRLGSTIIVPNDFIKVSGADFDIDSLYIIRRHFNTYRVKDDKTYDSQEFVDFAKKFLMSYAPMWAGEYIKFDRKKVIKKYLDGLLGNAEKVALLDRVNKARYTVKADDVSPETASLLDQIEKDYSIESEYVYDAETGDYIPDQSQKLLPPKTEETETLSDIDYTDFIDLSIIKAALTAYNVEFKKKNKALTYYENIASPSEYATDVTLYDSLLKDSLNSKEGKTIVERGLKNFKEKNLSEMANFLLESLGYKSRVNPDLSSEDYAELITTLLEAKEVDSITELLTKNNFKPMIDLLVKSGLIPSFEEFVKLSDEKKWTNKQIDNGIFDVYQGILNSPLHYREQTNALDAQFPDVQEARNMLEGLTGVKLHKLNVNRPEDIEKLKQINLSVRELKGISAGLDGFYSIAQRTNMRLAVDIAPIIMYEDVTPEKFEYLNKTYKEDILDYDSANQTVTIRHRYIFNNPAGTYLNYDGRFIDSVSSQATSNILDAVKFFLPANVNDYTISLWKALVAVGVGNGWKYPTSFINQPVIVEIIRLHEITNNITYNGTLKDKEIEHIKRKYQDELFELIKTEFEASNAKGVSANRLAKVLQDYSTTKKNSASGLVNIKRVDTEMLLGYNPDKPVPMSLEMLNKMIEASTSEKAASVKARQALLIGQLQVLETYVKLRKVAESLTDGVTTFNTDKTTANDAVTINLIDKIIKIDNYENEGSRLFIGATSAARAIYPLFFGDTESASAYPPLQHYFYYSHLMAQGVMGQFDIRKTGKFMEFLYNFDPKVRDRVANYVLATSVKDLDFFNNTSKMRVLGIETPLNTKLIIDFNKNIDKFNELSFANKTELLKKKFANNKKYKGYTFTLFDYLAPKITHEAVEKKDYQAVDYIYDGKNLNPFILEIAEMYYSGEPYLRSFAEDLIRYSYYTDGFTYGFKTLSKIIPISVLYKDTEQGGIGYNKLLLERANLIKSPGADGILTPEKMKSVYRANWKNSRIVPIARNRKRFNRVREGSAQAKIGIKSGWTNNSWFPDYTADKKGIIAIPYNKFLNESQRIQTSPFIRVKKDAQPIIFRSDSTSLEKIAKEQKTQITTIKDKNEYKIGDILNISNQGLNIHKGKVYKFTNGNWYSIAYLDNGFTKNTQITDKQLLTELNTEFEQPTKFIAVEVTSVREEGGAEYFERVSLMHEIELEAHIAAEGYKGDRIGFLRYLKAIGVKEGEKTAQIITFKKKGEISNRMKKGVGSDMIYEKYVSEKSGTLDTIYFFPVNKLLPYEDSEYSVIDDYNVEFSREEYMNYILSKESLQAKKDNPIQDRVEEEMTILDEYTLKNIKTLPNESVFDINGHVLIQSPITKYDTVSRKALKQQSIEQVDAVINFVINPNEPFNNVIRNLAGDKYIEIVMGSGVDYLPIVEKLNELKANNLFITGQSQNTLRGQLGLQEYKTRMYVTDVLKAIAVHKNIKQRLDGVLTNGNTGIEESANHAAEEIGASSVIRMNSNFVADGMGNPISGNNSLDRFTSERKLATITSNPTEEFEDLPDFLDNGGEPYFNIKSAAERLKNLAQFTVDNYNNFKTRTKYIHNDKTLNQVVEELNDLDFDDIYHNFDTYQLKDALVSTYRYYVITQVSIGNMMRMYDTEIDFEELLDTQERKTEFANRMRYANAFIQGFSSVRNIEYLSKGFDVLDTQIEKLKELEPSISSLKSMYDRIMKRYYEFELLKYSTNPEIKAGLKELFDPQRDMNWGELYLDSLGDTENSFLSNLFKKYATTMIISNDEYKRELRDFNKEYAKFAGNDPKEQVIKRFIDKYISKDKDGNPTGYLISKIDLVAWKEAYKKYMEEVDQVQKKTRSRSKVNDVHAKWIKILYNQTSLDEEGRTPDEAMAVMKAKLSGKLYVKWYKENIDYDSKKAKYYFRSEKSDTFIDPKYTAIKDDPFYQYLSKTVAHYMSFYHTNDFNRTLKKGALPAMMQGEDESWWDKAKSRMGWFDRKNKSFLGENDEIMRTIPINFVNAMVTEKPFVPALPKRPRESYLSWQVRRVEQAEEITGKKFKDEHEVKKYNEEVRAENDKHHGMAISYDIENIMTAFLKNIINYKNKRSIESEMLLGKELLKTLPVLKKGKGGKPTLNPLKTKILNKPVYAVMPGEQSDLLKRYEKFLEMVLYEDFELDEGTWQKLARVLQNYTSMTGMWVNFTGAVNNVAIGKAQSAMEGFSGYFWNRKDANKAEADFWGSVATNIAEIGSETTDNFNVALMKKFSVAQYDDGTADPAENRKNFVHKHLLTTNAMYVMHHMGEYYMQNVNFLSMLHSHRVIDGKIFSLVEYKNDLREKALLEVLTDKQKAEYAEYMDTIKDDRLKNPDKYGVDHIRPFAKNLDKDTLKKYRDKLGQFEEKAKKEFEAHPTLKDSYELKEGVAELKDTSKVDKIEEAKFINKALHVIQKIHGIYNTMDAGMIQNKALGRLAIQFRKWMRPGWNKRFGSKFGKEFWNEQRNEKDKGSYVSFWNFFTEPITDSFKAEMKEEHFNVLRATQRIISDYMRFLANVRLHYGTLDDFEKGNVKRALGEMMMIIGAILIGNLLTKLRGDDDDDDLYVINLAMYIEDRFKTDLQAFVPISPSGGWFNESKKLLRSPFAGFSTLEDLTKLLMYATAYPFQDEEERIYQNGLYSGMSKVGVAFKRSVPIAKQVVKLKRIEDYVEYYKLWSPY